MDQNDVTPEIVEMLAVARLALRRMGTEPMDRPSALYAHHAHELVNAFAALDDAGVFAALDEAVQSDRAEAILAESAVKETAEALADFNEAYTAASRLGSLERVPGTDTLRPARLPEPEEVADEWSARARAIESIRPTGRRSHGSLAADND